MKIEANDIYDKITYKINNVINELKTSKDVENIPETIDNLNILNNSIQKEYYELKRLSEWNRFTIAFYGETNAGKSTLIEALRLLLGEHTKKESQKQFKILTEKNGLTQEAFDKTRQMIMDCEHTIENIKQEISKIDIKYAEPIMLAEVEITRLSNLLEEIKSNQKWWQRIISWFIKSKEKNELIAAKQALAEVQSEHRKEAAASERFLKDKILEKNTLDTKYERLLKESEVLKQFADGQIIGDGRSDFTRNNTSFEFEYDNQKFSLIDVPGIEGNEEVVRIPIEEAVKKAHAVFYVTRTPRPPQTHEGDEINNKKGTLQKIKDHLGSQTEIWTIYNHAVNNPRQLKKPLVGEGEISGLQALDRKLKEELAEKYCHSLILSARPAYLSLTECVLPGSKEATEQRKFLQHFKSKKEILELSGLLDFVSALSSTIIGDYRNKIKYSNLNKAYKILEKSINELSLLNQTFNTNRKDIRSEILNAQTQIKILLEQFSGSLDAAGSKVIRNFEKNIRNRIYSRIDNDISNDEFKVSLSDILKSESESLENNLISTIKDESHSFETEISRVVKRSNTHLKNIINSQNRSLNLNKFNMDINIDNGVQLFGLISSGVGVVMGAVLLASNPAGWTFAFIGGVLAVVGALIGAAKSVIGFFSSSYKQSQQKKEADKAIRSAKSQINKKMEEILTSIKESMNEQIQFVLIELEMPLKQYESITQTLDQAEKELSQILQTIKLKGNYHDRNNNSI